MTIPVTAKLSDILYKDLLKLLETGRWIVGMKIPSEVELSKSYGVSRAVLREALVRLKLEGYIESRRGSGSVVKSVGRVEQLQGYRPLTTILDLVHCFEFRMSIEGDAAFRAAQRRTAQQLQTIWEAIQALNQIADDNDFVRADFAFHLAIAEAASNPMYDATIMLMRANVEQSMRFTGEFLGPQPDDRVSMASVEHSEIFDHIKAQDPRAARSAMIGHLKCSRQRLLGYEFEADNP